MNKELKDRVFDVPQDILNLINHTITGLQDKNTHGVQRAQNILNDKKVTYGQLKRIIHDLQGIDKIKDISRYNLYGGQLMDNWSKKHLQGERDLISNRKEGRKDADEMAAITGERKNSYLKKHTKKFGFTVPTNLIKSNSHKSSITPITSLGLFEEIEKIKKLITY